MVSPWPWSSVWARHIEKRKDRCSPIAASDLNWKSCERRINEKRNRRASWFFYTTRGDLLFRSFSLFTVDLGTLVFAFRWISNFNLARRNPPYPFFIRLLSVVPVCDSSLSLFGIDELFLFFIVIRIFNRVRRCFLFSATITYKLFLL